MDNMGGCGTSYSKDSSVPTDNMGGCGTSYSRTPQYPWISWMAMGQATLGLYTVMVM